jgi:DNA-binding transcriptional LysR family regulator
MQLRFTLRQLEYFTVTAHTGSIAATSRILNVSSPSISTALSQLEKDLGAVLFVRRRPQGLSLTEAGRTLSAQAELILNNSTELTRMAGMVSHSIQGHLHLGCLVSFAQIVVPKLRRSFEAAHPAVKLSQSELTQSEIFTALRQGDIDLAISYAIDLPNDLEFQAIKSLPPFVMLAPDHPLAKNKILKVEQLTDHAMVLLDLPLSSDYFLSFFNRTGPRPIIAERTKDLAVARSLVANGFGFSVINYRPIGTHAPDGKPLIFVPLESEVPPLPVGLLSLTGLASRSIYSAFLDLCREEMK